jgi:multicomponent K+:H+ antiporter subunit G
LHAWLIIIFLSLTVPVTTILLARTELFRRRTHGASSAEIPPPLSHVLHRYDFAKTMAP